MENHKKTFNSAAPRDLMDVYLQVLQSDNPDDTFSGENQYFLYILYSDAEY